jgi:hypothetical protein
MLKLIFPEGGLSNETAYSYGFGGSGVRVPLYRTFSFLASHYQTGLDQLGFADRAAWLLFQKAPMARRRADNCGGRSFFV